nr:MAG TPA: hypothetical protein [Caudoviricetes sp.]
MIFRYLQFLQAYQPLSGAQNIQIKCKEDLQLKNGCEG